MPNTSALALTSVIRRSGDHLLTQVGDDVMMASEQDGNYYRLDPIAARIWDLLTQPCSVSALCDELQQDFAVDRATCERDVLRFLKTMRESGLIQILDVPPSA